MTVEPVRPTDTPELEEDTLCPLCEYSLYGITQPRCPECGYAFDWPEITDPRRRLHRYLFEHHPERNGWSFWKTAVGGLLPRRFWSDLHPVQPSNRRRLLIYWLLTMAVLLAGSASYYVEKLVTLRAYNRQQRLLLQTTPPPAGYEFYINYLKDEYGSLRAALDATHPLPPSPRFFTFVLLYSGIAVPVLFYILWPWLTFLALLIFRWSMARARIDRVHVLRCVLYSWDVGLWTGLAILATGAAAVVFSTGVPDDPWMVLCLLLAAHSVYRLWMAYRKYLRFPHAFATVLSSQLIAFLAFTWVMITLHL